jgi:hypothetical protein
LANVTAYSLAGAFTSVLVGAGLGMGGALALPEGSWRFGAPILLALAAVMVARELGWISFRLPQPRRQTRDVWARFLDPTVTATLWGLDLGLFFTTQFTFSGMWLLALLPVLARDAGLGGALFLAYWLGRAVSVWVTPFLLESPAGTPRLLDELSGQHRLFQLVHVAGLGSVVAFLIASLT